MTVLHHHPLPRVAQETREEALDLRVVARFGPGKVLGKPGSQGVLVLGRGRITPGHLLRILPLVGGFREDLPKGFS